MSRYEEGAQPKNSDEVSWSEAVQLWHQAAIDQINADPEIRQRSQHDLKKYSPFKDPVRPLHLSGIVNLFLNLLHLPSQQNKKR